MDDYPSEERWRVIRVQPVKPHKDLLRNFRTVKMTSKTSRWLSGDPQIPHCVEKRVTGWRCTFHVERGGLEGVGLRVCRCEKPEGRETPKDITVNWILYERRTGVPYKRLEDHPIIYLLPEERPVSFGRVPVTITSHPKMSRTILIL